MRPRHRSSVIAALAAGGLLVLAACGTPAASPAAAPAPAAASSSAASLRIVGLVDGTALANLSSTDTALTERRDITGLDGDTSLVGIDYRVQDGSLHGVGNEGGVYKIEDGGAASKLGTLTESLSGTSFGVDFNPAANALRVVGDDGQNLRQPFAATPLAATVSDGKLTNPAMAPATGTVPAKGVTAAAYTNNDTEMGTATTLFVLDTTADRVSVQSPANAGSLAATGSLGVDATDAGFDVYSSAATPAAQGFATLRVGGAWELHSVDLLAGKATRVGALDGAVTDIAVRIMQ